MVGKVTKTFMVLGGSAGQIPAIRLAKTLGFQTLVTDMNSDALGASEADIFEAVNTINKEASLEIAKQYNICGAMTISSDIAVPTVCYINEKLNLSNQGIGISENVTDKALMRGKFKEFNVMSPEYFVYEKQDDLEAFSLRIAHFLEKESFIVKPTDSSGSRGVAKITNLDELEAAIQNAMKFTRNDKVIVEQFIEGIEIGAQGFSLNGEMWKCYVHNDTISKNMIPIGHSFPYLGEGDVIDKIMSECSKALQALGIENGPSNIDIILTSENIPYIIEIGARIGATKLPDIVKYHSGWDLIEATIHQSTGETVSFKEKELRAVAVEMIYFEECGKVQLIDSYDDLIEKYEPLEYELTLQENEQVQSLKSGVDVYGYVICEGETATEAEKSCSEFIQALKEKIHLKKEG